MTTRPNNSAFPSTMGTYESYVAGLTIREYFAAMALQGLLAKPNFKGNCSKLAVEYADALIKELNLTQELNK